MPRQVPPELGAAWPLFGVLLQLIPKVVRALFDSLGGDNQGSLQEAPEEQVVDEFMQVVVGCLVTEREELGISDPEEVDRRRP